MFIQLDEEETKRLLSVSSYTRGLSDSEFEFLAKLGERAQADAGENEVVLALDDGDRAQLLAAAHQLDTGVDETESRRLSEWLKYFVKKCVDFQGRKAVVIRQYDVDLRREDAELLDTCVKLLRSKGLGQRSLELHELRTRLTQDVRLASAPAEPPRFDIDELCSALEDSCKQGLEVTLSTVNDELEIKITKKTGGRPRSVAATMGAWTWSARELAGQIVATASLLRRTAR